MSANFITFIFSVKKKHTQNINKSLIITLIYVILRKCLYNSDDNIIINKQKKKIKLIKQTKENIENESFIQKLFKIFILD